VHAKTLDRCGIAQISVRAATSCEDHRHHSGN
jgi:hypothetical protein